MIDIFGESKEHLCKYRTKTIIKFNKGFNGWSTLGGSDTANYSLRIRRVSFDLLDFTFVSCSVLRLRLRSSRVSGRRYQTSKLTFCCEIKIPLMELYCTGSHPTEKEFDGLAQLPRQTCERGCLHW